MNSETSKQIKELVAEITNAYVEAIQAVADENQQQFALCINAVRITEAVIMDKMLSVDKEEGAGDD